VDDRPDRERTNPFAAPRRVDDVAECEFYHAMDVPGHGTLVGQWDLRQGVDAYLGRFDFRGKRVLDVGAASGFLSFHVEARGAEVVSYDLSDDWAWDVVPFDGAPLAATEAERRQHIRRINNGYWLSHAALGSRAKVVYGTVYDIPPSIGPCDVALYGSILLHLRDPFLALQNGARLAREAIIVADLSPLGRWGRWLRAPRFRPDHRRPANWDTWWLLPPRLVREYLAILGFTDATVTWHRQLFRARPMWLYTVVARRPTRG
jgi:hypothetical protein